MLAEDFDGGIGGRQPAGQDELQARCGPQTATSALPWPRTRVTPDGARVTSHSPVLSSPGSVA